MLAVLYGETSKTPQSTLIQIAYMPLSLPIKLFEYYRQWLPHMALPSKERMWIELIFMKALIDRCSLSSQQIQVVEKKARSRLSTNRIDIWFEISWKDMGFSIRNCITALGIRAVQNRHPSFLQSCQHGFHNTPCCGRRYAIFFAIPQHL